MGSSLFVLCAFLPLIFAVAPGWNPKVKCGKSKYPDAGDYFLPAPSIVGGIEARPNEFPWQISLQSKKWSSHICGGSIINERWIMIAAHCINRALIDSYDVVVGHHKLISQPNATTVKKYGISKFIVHEKYGSVRFAYDIGLIKVKEDIKFDENVSPICAPESNDQYVHVKAAVSGWGARFPGDGSNIDELFYTTVNTTTNDYCQSAYLPTSMGNITKDMICASDNRNSTERDACQGDSGGPLMVKDKEGTFRLIGIVSWGLGCASNYPGVYTRVNYFEDWILEKMNPKPPVWNPKGTCGKSKYPDAGDYFLPAPSIVGGIEARPHEFPWQVSLQRPKTGNHFCGGSIINEKWVITAGHCVENIFLENYAVVAGLHKKVSNPDATCVQKFSIEKIIRHESYHSGFLYNDIALMKVKGVIKFDENVSPICAPKSNDIYAHVKAAVSGWGDMFSGDNVPVDTLRYTTLNTTTNEYCRSVYRPSGVGNVTADMICASDNRKSNERDSCQGDSGGPLVVKDEDGTFRLIGIVSWGMGCADGYPGVYNRVNYFEEWVLKNIET